MTTGSVTFTVTDSGGHTTTATAAYTTQTTAAPLVGFYNGGPSTDDAGTAVFGKPDLASTYYQPGQIGNIVNAETPRVGKGIRPLVTITTMGGTTTLNQIAAGQTAWLDQYIAALATLSNVNTSVPVYATLDHEFEVKSNAGNITGVSDSTYAAAWNRFATQLRATAPKVKLVYWCGGYDKASVGTILAAMTVAPDVITFDPYSSASHSASETFATTVNNYALTWLKANADYARLGSPPIALSECGSDTAHGDASVAAWLTGLRTQAANLGLAWVVLFNRDSSAYKYKIDGGSFPSSAAAFKSSVTA